MSVWSALSPAQRSQPLPVAARDYWDKPGLRGYIANKVLHAVLIERRREERDGDPLEPVVEALQAGASLILFPEGTRTAERLPQRFRGGLFRHAEVFPVLQLVPAYLVPLHRSIPKGAPIPPPLYCTRSEDRRVGK